MITARSPYQVYKTEVPTATVSEFCSLSSEDALPFKITSAEETLVASLVVVEQNAAQKATYGISAVHAAVGYIAQLISFIPLSTRSQTARQVLINYDALVRVVMLYCTETSSFESVKQMVLRGAPALQVSMKELSDLENVLADVERDLRQKVKDSGEKVEMLRKVAPDPAPSLTAVSTPRKSVTPALTALPPSAAEGDSLTEEANPVTALATQSGGRKKSSTSVLGAVPKRRRSSAAPSMATDADANDTSAPLKTMKTEESESEAAAATPARKPRAPRAPKSTAGASAAATAFGSGANGLVWGRLRGLTNNEKKAVALLQSMIVILGHVYASRFNDLVPIFDLFEVKLKMLEEIMDTERRQYEAKADKKPPEPFHEVDLASLRLALETSSHTFRTDEECRQELDEDLLHSLAHACLTLVNQIEGFTTEPYKQPTPEEVETKRQARRAVRAKQEEVQEKLLLKAAAKAELERKKEEEKLLLRRRLGYVSAEAEQHLIEDVILQNPSKLGYVAYPSKLPLESAALYEKALFVWSMIVSLPRALNLSQMTFPTFLRGLECEDQANNGLMEEMTRCLLDVSMEVASLNSPGTARVTTRGKDWFDALVEYVGVASGNRKKRQQQQQKRKVTSSEESDDSDSESDFDSSSSSSTGESGSTEEGSSEESGSKESGSAKVRKSTEDAVSAEPGQEGESKKMETAAAAAGVEGATVPAKEEEADSDAFSLELKATMEHLTQLRNLATWGNADVVDRLNLLQFCVQESLNGENVRAEADRLQRDMEEAAINADKRMREIRDEAEKELKALIRSLPASSAATAAQRKGQTENAVDYEVEREKVLQAVDHKREAVYAGLYGAQDGKDVGAIIAPLGMDRHRRLYWRFPFDRVVRVQTVPQLSSPDFPLGEEPEEVAVLRRAALQRNLLLDDEDMESWLPTRGRRDVKPSVSPAASAVPRASDAAGSQHVWGSIPFEYLHSFVKTLDRRGRREGPLRQTLETMAPYLAQMEEPVEGRMTRSRANMFGYLNRLKVDYSY